ncbi:tRNA(Ser) Um(44) 2'-O-methyltransferase [Exophiala xenobiotica]|nr:tRNA(Ser) Um(44) 2'-O-methyltransferase [Exophiala xenobiotica]
MALSRLSSAGVPWETAGQYQEECPCLTDDKFMQVTNLLLENPNLNSTHLFRADILQDSAKTLKTVIEKEQQCEYSNGAQHAEDGTVADSSPQTLEKAPQLDGATLTRKVLRRLIPRKPQLDSPLNQWCYVYDLLESPNIDKGQVVVYVPDVDSEADMPWYHPPIKSLAYCYKRTGTETTLSVHYLPFTRTTDPLPSRLHRTFISLLRTFLRLAKNPGPAQNQNGSHVQSNSINAATNQSMTPSALKDTILPQHVVQDTYSRLKQQYAQDLISRWAESTEPSKHVFEDLSIAAFVIELWKQMYTPDTFPGFVDIACGNGVLSYILIQEGYQGRGFDARRRKSWAVLGMNDHLDEMICVPQPFLDAASEDEGLQELMMRAQIYDGLFKPGTFVISNHADELTPWTPVLAALACPEHPLPFLAIPCCSHALSGAKHRYSPKDIITHNHAAAAAAASAKLNDQEEQPASGDLKTLRAAKVKAANHADDKSMYACLTRKVVALAEEIGFDVELTLMRIPSTRNIGIVGNRKRASTPRVTTDLDMQLETLSINTGDMTKKIHSLIERECTMSGGIQEAATTWIERAEKLQKGSGRGKVNLRGKQQA